MTASSLSRRGLLAAAGLTTLLPGLAACGSSATPAAGGSGTASAAGTRTVIDATGASVTVPAKPARVVSLHYAGTQAVLDLGGSLVGTGLVESVQVPEAYEAKLKSVPVVTSADGPKVEQVAAQTPDLILAPNTYNDSVLGQLRQIAPVFQFTLRGGKRAEWQTRVKETAVALGMEDAYAALQKAFADEIKAAAAKVSGAVSKVVVGTLSSYEANTAYLWGSKNMIGTILLPLGVTWSQAEDAAVAGEKEPEKTISPEALPKALADVTLLFVDSTLRGETPALTKALQTNPLYKGLPVVQAGKVFPIGKFTVAGFADARYSLAQAVKALTSVA